jgi:hypothetical protein
VVVGFLLYSGDFTHTFAQRSRLVIQLLMMLQPIAPVAGRASAFRHDRSTAMTPMDGDGDAKT